jgi:3-methylfumaryl-CoA hydratase
LESYQDWIGKTEEIQDQLSASPAQRMAATLNQPTAFVEGAPLPPVWHWLYFLPAVRMDHTSEDGHAKRGGFLPPVTLPRRMWAGGRIVFHQPLHIGERALKKSRVSDVTSKQGKSGDLVFVKITHEIVGENGLALLEEQDIVFREPATNSTPLPSQPAPVEAQWSQTITPDPVLLFRYSALTFNSHRIHYDRDYCRNVEGYPGLVVHGPLTATLLLESLRAHVPHRTVKTFSFRAVSPLYDDQPFRVEGRIDENDAQMWALNPEGSLAMQASATLD